MPWMGRTRIGTEKEAGLLEQPEDGDNKGRVLGQGGVVGNKWVFQSREKFTGSASLTFC